MSTQKTTSYHQVIMSPDEAMEQFLSAHKIAMADYEFFRMIMFILGCPLFISLSLQGVYEVSSLYYGHQLQVLPYRVLVGCMISGVIVSYFVYISNIKFRKPKVAIRIPHSIVIGICSFIQGAVSYDTIKLLVEATDPVPSSRDYVISFVIRTSIMFVVVIVVKTRMDYAMYEHVNHCWTVASLFKSKVSQKYGRDSLRMINLVNRDLKRLDSTGDYGIGKRKGTFVDEY